MRIRQTIVFFGFNPIKAVQRRIPSLERFKMSHLVGVGGTVGLGGGFLLHKNAGTTNSANALAATKKLYGIEDDELQQRRPY